MIETKHSLANDGRAETMPELRYAYYRRCQRLRKNGEQCKAPALKGCELCYKHTAMVERAQRETRQVAALQLPPLINLRNVNQAIGQVMQALLDGRLHARPAGRLVIYLQTVSVLMRRGGCEPLENRACPARGCRQGLRQITRSRRCR